MSEEEFHRVLENLVTSQNYKLVMPKSLRKLVIIILLISIIIPIFLIGDMVYSEISPSSGSEDGGFGFDFIYLSLQYFYSAVSSPVSWLSLLFPTRSISRKGWRPER
jgi:hypothetical protein